MNFKEIENIENQVASTETAASSSYQMQMLAEFLKRKSGNQEQKKIRLFISMKM